MEQWFDLQTKDTIVLALSVGLAMAGGTIGCAYGFCIRKGWKKLIYAVFAFFIVVYTGLFITGLIALLIKQPHHVWFSFLFPGLVGTIIFWGLFPVMCRKLTENELRKMQAKDL